VGSKQFRAEMLEHIEEQRGKWHYGAELSESAEAKAERLISEALRVEGIRQEQLASWRKGHPFKVELAAKLRAETTVSVRRCEIIGRDSRRRQQTIGFPSKSRAHFTRFHACAYFFTPSQLDCAALGDGNPGAFSAPALSEGPDPRRAAASEPMQTEYLTLSLTDTLFRCESKSHLSASKSGSD
jgi:hypothetical protein